MWREDNEMIFPEGFWMRNCLRAVCVIGMLISAMLCGLEAQAAPLQTLRVGYVPGTGFLEEDRPGHLRGYGYE